jgi:hypothetical protein
MLYGRPAGRPCNCTLFPAPDFRGRNYTGLSQSPSEFRITQ